MLDLPASPYPWRESLAAATRMFRAPPPWSGPPSGARRVADRPAAARLVFAGDVLPVRTSTVTVSDEVIAAFAGADAVVANLEGILTDRPWLPFLQKHTPRTFDVLTQLAPPGRWWLGLANNHAGDYGEAAFEAHVAAVEARGFRTFGRASTPTITPVPGVTITTWTAWQNRPSPWVATAPMPAPPGWRVAYPHHGREFVRDPAAPVPGFDASFGHHAHLAGDVSVIDGQIGVASLGNLLTEVKVPPMGEGLVVAVDLDADGPIALRWTRLAITRAWGRVHVGAAR